MRDHEEIMRPWLSRFLCCSYDESQELQAAQEKLDAAKRLSWSGISLG